MTMSLSGCAKAQTQPTAVHQDPFSQLTLENGLQVVWQEDHRQPLVAIEARILGGLRGEGILANRGQPRLRLGTPRQ